jgi:7-cyano-7-deazaguanine reductase
MHTNHRPSRKVAKPQVKAASHTDVTSADKTHVARRNRAPAHKSQTPSTQPLPTNEPTRDEQTRGLTLLGAKSTHYSDQYSPAILETFENRHQEYDYFVKFNCPEFTSLCPITGQPDFATIYISYIPDKLMVESKSLKLYLFGFRNHGAFHEDCINIIMKDLIKLMAPRYIEVWGKFLPRGGLSIDPYVNYGRPSTQWEEFARQRLLMHDLSPELVNNR